MPDTNRGRVREDLASSARVSEPQGGAEPPPRVWSSFLATGRKRVKRVGRRVGRDDRGKARRLKALAKRSKTTQRSEGPPKATYVEDRGAVYDAPIEVVWDFMDDETFHSKAHTAAVRNFKAKPLSEVSTLISYEKRRGKRWERMVCRMTTIRPAVRIQEDLIGPYAGSKTVFLYTSKGERTVVDVFGYVQSSEMTPAEVRKDRKRTWANAYSEDLPYFRRFVDQHRSMQSRQK
jgi:hypothetical protein